MKHTKGPWQVADYDGEPAVTIDKYTIASLDQGYYGTELPESEVRANADLIAAAPELLETLEALLTEYIDVAECTRADCECKGNSRGKGLVVQARAAIAKAKGE